VLCERVCVCVRARARAPRQGKAGGGDPRLLKTVGESSVLCVLNFERIAKSFYSGLSYCFSQLAGTFEMTFEIDFEELTLVGSVVLSGQNTRF